jgi:HEXXH motif-containing protein
MIVARHRIPEKVFFALAAGGGGGSAIASLLAAQYSKRLLLLRGVRDTASSAGADQSELAEQAYRLLTEVQKRDPDAVDSAVRYPSVGVWAWQTLLALRGDRAPDGAGPGGLAAVAAAAAIRARFPCTIRVPLSEGTVVLPSLGRALLPGSAGFATVRSGAAETEVVWGRHRVLLPSNPFGDAPGWQGLRRLAASARGVRLDLLLDDHDPYRMPGAATTTSRLPAKEVERWRELLHRAWGLLLRYHWTTAEEVAAAITVLTPLQTPVRGQVSATSRLAFGTVGLSAPDDVHALAVTLAHEVQHTKLCALADVTPLTHRYDGGLHYAPWRDDPRPIDGLLQGVYAHLGIAGFWRRQAHHECGDEAVRAHAEFARWREAAEVATHTLEQGEGLTSAGRLFVAEMARTLHAWSAEPVPPLASELAREAAERHRARWRSRHGYALDPRDTP